MNSSLHATQSRTSPAGPFPGGPSLEPALKAMVSNAPAAVAVFDREMRYLWASQRWMSDFALDPDEILGRSHYEVFPDIPERWKAIHRRCLAGATESSDEDSFIGLQGTRVWLRWKVQP